MRACSAGSSLGRLTCRAVKRTNEAGKYSPGGSRWRRTTSNAIVVVGHELPPIASRGTNKQTDQQSGWLRAGDNEASEAPICPHDRRRRPPCHLPAYSRQPAKGDSGGCSRCRGETAGLRRAYSVSAAGSSSAPPSFLPRPLLRLNHWLRLGTTNQQIKALRRLSALALIVG